MVERRGFEFLETARQKGKGTLLITGHLGAWELGGMVLASDGFYASRRDRVEAVAAARSNRVFVELAGGHNVHLLRPGEVARVVRDLIARASEPSASW